ncbi:MAG: hypothetical protein ACFFER_17135 [Candidatus Thorarchaeota archaeon]
MTEQKNPIKRITTRIESGREFSIEFEGNDLLSILNAYFEAAAVCTIIEHIAQFRTISTDNGNGFFVPNDPSLNQMRKLCISAAASFPKVLPSEFIETILGIPFNSYKVYATAKEHESSKYLELDENKGISFSLDGVSWLNSIL